MATLILGALYVLHQDFWFWTDARPLVFGFLPIGLFYHAAYTVITALTLIVLVRMLWPGHLERANDGSVAQRADLTVRPYGRE